MAVKLQFGRLSILYKGDYDALLNYEKLDIVSYNGNSYVCIKDSTGILPTNNEYWRIIAKKGIDGKSAYELYIDSITHEKEFTIVDHTNFADARHNQLEDYYNNYPEEASNDGEEWPAWTPSAFPWLVVNHAFDGHTILKVFYKNTQVLSYIPTAKVEAESGELVDRTYAIIGVPSLDYSFAEFAETTEGTTNLLNKNDFQVVLIDDDKNVEQWLASLKGADGQPGKSAYQSYLDTTSDEPKLTESQWIESFSAGGSGGGITGKSAYESYLDTTDDDPKLSEADWVASLHGHDGLEGSIGPQGLAGQNGITPHIDPTTKHWMIGETDTFIIAEGTDGNDGTNGTDGITPHIDPVTKHWMIGETDTNVLAEGKNGQNGADGQDGTNGTDGITPHIDPVTKHWMIDETDTGVLAEGTNGTDGINGTNGTDGITPHIDSTTGNWFIGTVNTYIHAQGQPGQDGSVGPEGPMGPTGPTGATGPTGKSAYQSYLDTTGDDPVLTEAEWIESLHGQDGLAGLNGTDGITPHIDSSTGNWFIGTVNTYIHAQGANGINGKSAYELYLETVPQDETPLSQIEWLNSLNGTDGINGANGTNGKSAYELYLDHVPNGTTPLTESQWLASLKGSDGSTGPRGFEGKSAYEIYYDSAEDPMSEEDWLASLKGADGTMSFEDLTDEQRESLVGETGPAGKSAYQSYLDTTVDNPKLTEIEWIASLHGQDGQPGQDGSTGPQGPAGQNGNDGITPHIDPVTKHWMIGETDTFIIAEGIDGNDGTNGNDGITPHIDPTTGNWFIGSNDTGVHAQGPAGNDGANGTNGTDGITPHIDSSTGNWFIGTVNTYIHAQGPAGLNGNDGITPHIDSTTGNWFIGDTDTGISAQGPAGNDGLKGADGSTGKSAYELYYDTTLDNPKKTVEEWLESLKGTDGSTGNDGITPHIDSTTGNWFIGDTDTGISAQGPAGLNGANGLNGTDGITPHIDSSTGNWFIGTVNTYIHAQGQAGQNGKSAYQSYLDTTSDDPVLSEADWIESLKGADGQDGTNGTNGTNGKSAYELYVDHVPNGSTALTEEQWLVSLKGLDGSAGVQGIQGKSAYEIYVENVPQGGTVLDISSWLVSLKGADGTMTFEDLTPSQRESLKGDDGSTGKSAYELYLDHVPEGSTILTEEQWLASLRGKDGSVGQRGYDGKSAYDVYLDNISGSETPLNPVEWIESLKGADGKSAYEIYLDVLSGGETPLSEAEWILSLHGADGSIGKSAYQSYLDTTSDDPVLSEVEWLATLKGVDGSIGVDGSTGKSAYEVYVDNVPQGETVLDVSAWLASLKGIDGSVGPEGPQGDSAYQVAVANGFEGTEEEWLDSLLPSIGTDPSTNNASDIYWFIKGEKTQYRAVPQIINITSAAYDALQEKDETAIYVITDSQYNQDNEVTYRIGNITPTTDMNNLDVSVRRTDNVIYFDFTLPIANLDVSNLTEAQATLLRGKSNYQIYVDNHDIDLDGPLLTEEQWLATLKGEVGNDGKSTYELYAENYISTHGDDTGMLTESEWLNSLIPQIVQDSSNDLYWYINNQKTQYRAFPKIEFLTAEEYEALVEKEDDIIYIIDDNKSATDLAFNIGNVTTSSIETDASVNIRRLDNSIYFDFVLPFSIDSSEYKGESAYEIYKKNVSTGELLSESQWLESLKGKSAYEIYADTTSDNPVKTEAQWIASLKGETGRDGSRGEAGPMADISINSDGYWVINSQVSNKSALGRLPEISTGLYIDPDTGDEIAMNTWWLNGIDTNIPTSLGIDISTLNKRIGNIGNALEYEPSTYYTAEDDEVIGGTKEVGDLKTPAIPAIPHTVKSYIDNKIGDIGDISIGDISINMDNIYTKIEVSTLLENYVTVADISANEYVIANALIDLHETKVDASTVYTKAEIDNLLQNVGGSVDPNDLSIYELKEDLSNDLSIYVLHSELDETLLSLNLSWTNIITNINTSILDISQNAITSTDLSIYVLKSDLANDLSIYELKSELSNDLSIYELKSDLANDLSIYELKSDLSNDLSVYVLNSSLIEVEEVIASAISYLNTNKTDVSTTYSKSEVDNLVQAVSATPGKSAYQSYVDTTLDDPVKSEAEWVASISGGNISLDTYVTYATLNSSLNNYVLNSSLQEVSTALSNKADKSTTYTKGEVDNLIQNAGTVKPNDLSIYELKSDLANDLSIYVLNSSLIDVEEVIATAITEMGNTIDELTNNVYTKDEIESILSNIESSVNPNDLSIYELKSDLVNDLSIYALSNSVYTKSEIDNIIANSSTGGSSSGGSINSSVLDDYVLKTYLGILPNKTEPIYYTLEEITNASTGDDAYGKTTTDIKTPATQYTNVIEAIEEGEEVTAAAIVDINNKVTDISTRLSNIVSGPAIWVGTLAQYNALESIDQSTIYIIKAAEEL